MPCSDHKDYNTHFFLTRASCREGDATDGLGVWVSPYARGIAERDNKLSGRLSVVFNRR